MMRMLLVRHGATTLTAEDRFSGDGGVELSDEGRAQVEALAARLALDQIRAVYAWPFWRTRETAAILANRHQLPVTLRDGLSEIGHGHWEGLTRSDVETRFAEEYGSWQQDPLSYAPAGGESGISVLARALPVIREIVVSPGCDTVLV